MSHRELAVDDVLRRARQRITNPAQWCQRRNRDRSQASDDDCAVCATAALRYAVDGRVGNGYDLADMAMLAAFRKSYGLLTQATLEISPRSAGPVDFNDNHSHPEVLAVFDRAIELAETAA